MNRILLLGLCFFVFLMTVVFSGCSENSPGNASALPGIVLPIPDKATGTDCYMTGEPRLVIQYSIEATEDSLAILDLYDDKITAQGWEAVDTSRKKYVDMAGDSRRGVSYQWTSNEKGYSVLFVMKTMNLPREDDRQEYEVNINVYPSASVRARD